MRSTGDGTDILVEAASASMALSRRLDAINDNKLPEMQTNSFPGLVSGSSQPRHAGASAGGSTRWRRGNRSCRTRGTSKSRWIRSGLAMLSSGSGGYCMRTVSDSGA